MSSRYPKQPIILTTSGHQPSANNPYITSESPKLEEELMKEEFIESSEPKKQEDILSQWEKEYQNPIETREGIPISEEYPAMPRKYKLLSAKQPLYIRPSIKIDDPLGGVIIPQKQSKKKITMEVIEPPPVKEKWHLTEEELQKLKLTPADPPSTLEKAMEKMKAKKTMKEFEPLEMEESLEIEEKKAPKRKGLGITSIIVLIISSIIGIILMIFTVISIMWGLLIPIAAYAVYVNYGDVFLTFDQIKTPYEFEKFLNAYRHTFISPPMFDDGTLGQTCDVWNTYQTKILHKGLEIYKTSDVDELWHYSPNIRSIVSKCRNYVSRPDIDLSTIKIKGKKQSGLSRLFSKFK